MTKPKKYDGVDHFEAMHGMSEEIAGALVASGLKGLPDELHELNSDIEEATGMLLSMMFHLRQEVFALIDGQNN